MEKLSLLCFCIWFVQVRALNSEVAFYWTVIDSHRPTGSEIKLVVECETDETEEFASLAPYDGFVGNIHPVLNKLRTSKI